MIPSTSSGQAPADFDLDAYLVRIGYAGARAPTVAALREVHLRHTATIPFENLDPLLRRPTSLEAGALQAKLVRGGRGGWCFEQNGLLRLALDAMGFATTGLAARVVWNAPPGFVGSRGHMLLRVEAEGESWIADAGFGGLTLTGPLALRTDEVQETPHERFRIVAAEGDLLAVEAEVAGAWKPLYRFDLQPQLRPDYEVTSWFLSTNPVSHFLRTVVAARPFAGGRWALRDATFTTHRTGLPSESRVVERADELRALLADTFGIALPDDDGLDAALEAAVERSAAVFVA